jgi:alpha-glucoside transport system substrate-binding protein
LAGTTVTLLDAGWGSTSLDAEIEVFEADTGINVNLVRPSGSLEPTFDRLPDGTRPDVTLVDSPGVLRQLAEARRLVDLGTYLDRDTVRAEVGDELTKQATVASGLYWLPLSFEVKDLVWYPLRAFQEAGYQVPRTIDELAALANRMAAAGRTPWCLANGRGPESGRTVTDWLEALVLRVGGTELYDRWTKHDVPFDHPDVRRAGALLDSVLFGSGFLHGGPSWSNQRDPDDAAPSLLGHPPACWMLQGSSFTINSLPWRSARLGEDLDYFRRCVPERTPPRKVGVWPRRR